MTRNQAMYLTIFVGITSALGALWGGLALLHAHEIVHDRYCARYATSVHGHGLGGTLAVGGLCLVAFVVSAYLATWLVVHLYRTSER